MRAAARGDDDAGPVVDLLGHADIVLLGEATHGTHEFYALRAAITRRLIEHHGFDAVALEADWPDALHLGRCVRGGGQIDVDAALGAFERFPRWMWRDRTFAGLARWLAAHNAGINDRARRVGVYGLDLYSLARSTEAVVEYLQRTYPDAAAAARQRYACFDALVHEPQDYGFETVFRGREDCERQAIEQLEALFAGLDDVADAADDIADEERFYAQRNAAVVADAERYYRAMFSRSDASWTCATPTWPTRWRRCARTSANGAAVQRGSWCGPTTPTSATRAPPKWARAASSIWAS